MRAAPEHHMAADTRRRPLLSFPVVDPLTVAATALRIAGGLAAGALIGAGGVLAVDEIPWDVPWDILAAGPVVLALGIVLFRLVLQASKHAADLSAELERRLVARTEDLETDLERERRRSHRLLVAWEAERAARVRLSDAMTGQDWSAAHDLAAVLELADRLGVDVRDPDTPGE